MILQANGTIIFLPINHTFLNPKIEYRFFTRNIDSKQYEKVHQLKIVSTLPYDIMNSNSEFLIFMNFLTNQINYCLQQQQQRVKTHSDWFKKLVKTCGYQLKGLRK